jgi:hypothetical protein
VDRLDHRRAAISSRLIAFFSAKKARMSFTKARATAGGSSIGLRAWLSGPISKELFGVEYVRFARNPKGDLAMFHYDQFHRDWEMTPETQRKLALWLSGILPKGKSPKGNATGNGRKFWAASRQLSATHNNPFRASSVSAWRRLRPAVALPGSVFVGKAGHGADQTHRGVRRSSAGRL